MIANSLTLPWDLGILCLLAGFLGICFAANAWLKRRSSRPFWMKACVFTTGTGAFIGFCTVFYGSFVEPQIITVTREAVSFPVQGSLRIAIISDLHVGPYKGARFLRRVVSRINALHPDLVLLAGDEVLTAEVTADVLTALEPLADLDPVIGVYSIMGNHDHSVYRIGFSAPRPADRSDAVAAKLASLNVTVLQNASVTVTSGENTFAIAGIEDALSGDADIVRTFSSIPSDMPTILLSHNPDVILDPAALQADLIVAGHTHGGQLRLPWYGPLASLPTHLGRKFDQGLFRLGSGATLAITRGVGESGPRARLFAPPEILLIETAPM